MKVEFNDCTFVFKVTTKVSGGLSYSIATVKWKQIGKAVINNQTFPSCYEVMVSYSTKYKTFTVAYTLNKSNALKLLTRVINGKDE